MCWFEKNFLFMQISFEAIETYLHRSVYPPNIIGDKSKKSQLLKGFFYASWTLKCILCCKKDKFRFTLLSKNYSCQESFKFLIR